MRRRIRITASLAALVTPLAIVGVGAGADMAWAGTCSSKTGGSSNTLIYTGSGYTCAYVASNGNNSIGMWATESFTSSTAKGFEKRYHCDHQTGGVTITYIYTDSAGTGIGSSITFTAFNGEDGKRHWTGAVLWNTPDGGSAASDQFNHSCSGYTVQSNLMYISKASLSGPSSAPVGTPVPLTLQVTAPDGGGTPSGTVALFRQIGDRQSPMGKRCDGSSNGGVDPMITATALSSSATATLTLPAQAEDTTVNVYASYLGRPVTSSNLPSYCLAPPQSGLTGALSNSLSITIGAGAPTTATPVEVVPAALKATVPLAAARSAASTFVSVVEQRGTGDLSVRCSRTEAVQSFFAGSATRTFGPARLGKRGDGVGVTLRGSPDHSAILQVTCRPISASAVVEGRIGRGSVGPDRLATLAGNGIISGGLGDDRLIARHSGTLLDGGFDADTLIVQADGGGAYGGFGNDRLEARGEGSILNGGPGIDRFSSGSKVTLINARDGRPGDIIVCGSSLTRVRADRGDVVYGPCTMV